jgi:hypothetical protein
MLLSCHAVSRVIKGLKALSIDSSTGVTLVSKEKLCISDFQGLAVLSLQDSLRRSTQEDIRCCRTQNSAQCVSTFQRTYKSMCSMACERSRFQRFISDPPPSSFKEIILSIPRLLQGLRAMSLAKAVSNGIKDKECKRFTQQERPPAPCMPEKDPVQETVSALKK